MSETAIPIEFRLREVRAGSATAYRGKLPAPPASAREPAPAADIARIAASLIEPPGLEVERESTAFVVRVPESKAEVRLTFGRTEKAALADLTLLGNDDVLAIRVAGALTEVFGPLEMSWGDERLVIESTEGADGEASRYAERRAEQVRALLASLENDVLKPLFGGLPLGSLPVTPPPQETRKSSKVALAILGLVVLGPASLWFYESWLSKAALGASCTENLDCRSRQCLPRARAPAPVQIGTYTLPSFAPPPSAAVSGGVCTRDCITDDDCSSGLRCRSAVERTSFGGTVLPGGVRVLRCQPEAWDGDR